jgi:phosphate-selective porin OprO/OprP
MSHADELADLKAMQMAMQKQMKVMYEKIEELERKEKSRLAAESPANQEKVVQIPINEREEIEIERVIDNYLTKKEARQKLVPNSIRELTNPGSPSQFNVYWDKGLRFKSEDGNFKLKIGGRIMNDWGWFDEDNDILRSIGDQVDGTEFRRARLYLSGEIYKNIRFKAQYDFAGGDPEFKSVYMELKKIPILGNFRVGQFKEPFSLEELTSSKYITFMERSLNNVFAPGRNTGFMLHNHALDKRITWAGGVFRNSDDFGDSEGDSTTEGGYSFSGRITGLPWYKDKGKKLIHAGLSYSYQNAFENEFSFDSKPEIHLADDFVDTGSFAAEFAHFLNPELAIVYDSFSLQTEYTFADVDLENSTGSDPHFSGFYVYGSYFLTGEHRKYDTKDGEFNRVKPNKNFYWGKGMGAIELTARYSHLDLSDEAIEGGKLNDFTVGINWYLNPNTRVMLNYVHADADLSNIDSKKGGNADLAAMRFQIDF